MPYQTPPRFQEEYSAKLPALALLMQLGWQYLSVEQALAAREEKRNSVVLEKILRQMLANRRFEAFGQSHALSAKAVDHIVGVLTTPALNDGLTIANEQIYNHLLYGIPVTEFIDGKKATPTIPLIDWQQPGNNYLHVSEEFGVTRGDHSGSRRPDIVCFVNGLPLAIIEAKRPDDQGGRGPTVEAGVSQMLRNQKADEIQQLFAYSQLLLAINGQTGQYATCATPANFWAIWKEEDITEADMQALKNQPLTAEQRTRLFAQRPTEARHWYEQLIGGGELALTDQDRLLISLLSPRRLLEMTRLYMLFDQRIGKIVARYQQVFGIKRLVERIEKRDDKGARQGGVIWHTTGSGKSFTMVFLSKALIWHEALKNCRLLVVTDRLDLEEQLSHTFFAGGELGTARDHKSAMATSGRRLAEQIGHGDERIMFSLIQKFNSATKLAACYNDSPNMIVLIDEGHRSQGGENHERMKKALPNASFIAFTGTPLLAEDKQATTRKFGPIVHAYTMQQAVTDGMVTPLLYEERIPQLNVNEAALDAWFDRMTEGLSDMQKADLKRKLATRRQLYGSDDRIRLIAMDLANHLVRHVPAGLKAQLACDSKASAIRYKQYLDQVGLFDSVLVISPPDTREGHSSVDENELPEVQRWWQENVGQQSETQYTRQALQAFGRADGPRLLIVVDRLLTGFDVPRNAVLYIDKPLKSHNLIQAIARVNRLHANKQYGLLIDYRGILAELDTTIADYQDLASRTQGGFDIEDIAGLYHGMDTEYKRLPYLYDRLWNVFSDVANKQDIEQLRQALIPHMEQRPPSSAGDGPIWVDANQKRRDDFHAALSDFAACLKLALQSAAFHADHNFDEADRQHYKDTARQFANLRAMVRRDAGEVIDHGDHVDQVRQLLDRHVAGVAIQEAPGVYEVNQMGQSENPEQWNADKTRNETDLIRTRVARSIEQDLQDDPYAQEAFSQLLQQVIDEAARQFEHPLKQYWLFREFETRLANRQLDGIPATLQAQPQARAIFGIFKQELPQQLDSADPKTQDSWIDLALQASDIINQAVAAYSINPQGMAAEIRRQLLPPVLKQCQTAGAGMDQARSIIGRIVEIVQRRRQAS